MNKLVINWMFAVVIACSFSSDFPHTAFGETTLKDGEYLTACGPIACFVALESLGVETSLAEVVQRCNWKKDRLTPFEDLREGLNSYPGIHSQIVKLSPQQLCDLLVDDGTIVLLGVRKRTEQIDHAVCAVDTSQSGQAIHLIDYPELHRNLLMGEVVDRWDGVAIVVRMSPFYRAIDKLGLLFTPLVLACLGVLWIRNRCSRRMNAESDPVNEVAASDAQ